MNIHEELKKLHDIYGFRHVPWWQTTTFYLVAFVIAFLIVSSSIYFFYKKLKLKRFKRTPWELALIELDRLKNLSNCADQGRKFYFDLTQILKIYIHDRYGYDVMGKTDGELIIYLESVNFPYELLEALRKIFQGSATIKFANAQAACEQMEYDWALALMIIKKTIPSKK